MKKLILSILLTASQTIAGLPPTTTKGQSDAQSLQHLIFKHHLVSLLKQVAPLH